MTLRLYAPAIVLLVAAVVASTGCALAWPWLVVLAASFALHTHAEIQLRRRHR